MIRLVRAALAAPMLATALFTVSAITPIVPGPVTCASAAYTSRVALVVEHADGRVIRLCIGFDGTGITGEQILRASRVQYATTGYGSLGDAVCQIDAEPASYPPSCWTSSSPYWAMFVSRRGGPWTGADHGVSTESFANGDAEGFRYDPQNGPAGAPPSAGGVCAVSAQSNGTSPVAATTVQPQPSSAQGHGATAGPTPAAGTSPVAAVVSAPTPATRASPARVAVAPAAASPSVNVALLLASVGFGSLGGLAVARVLRRRRA